MRDENYGPKTRYSCGRTVFVYCALIMRGLRAYGPYIEITHTAQWEKQFNSLWKKNHKRVRSHALFSDK